MIKKVLIANRGEIALRVIRSCKEMGLKTVSVYSKADIESLHVRFADEAVCIGPAISKESYLSIPRIMAAAEITNSDAIHPGYGFLSENAEFSKICNESGIKFIGPDWKMIQKMGDKVTAKETMKKAGIPTVPGSDGLIESISDGKKLANKIGYPVILKATAGGGGKGMRIVNNEKDFESAWNSAKAESEASFSNSGLYLEKFIVKPRHIEIQVMGDQYGNVSHLSERDCSIQRRHQKLIEETPSPFVDDELRNRMREHGIQFKITKNRITKLALEKTRCKELSKLFTGPTTIALSSDAITSAKILTNFSKENENLKILGGIMGSDILDVAGVKNVATLPSLDEARAKIVGILRSPAQKIASILLAPASKIAILALEKSKK